MVLLFHEFHANFVYAFISFFSILNPIGMAAVFFTMTQDYTVNERRQIALRVAIYGSILLACIFLVGVYALSFFGISIGSLQIAGGFVLFSAAWAMLNQPAHPNKEHEGPTGSIADVAFFPITMPLTVGAGAIVVAITLALHVRNGGFFVGHVAVLLAILVNLALVGLAYGFSDRIMKLLGKSGTNVISRLTAFILLAISVQIAWNGIEGLIAMMGK
jgi:multiple antibiotic resistance protein